MTHARPLFLILVVCLTMSFRLCAAAQVARADDAAVKAESGKGEVAAEAKEPDGHDHKQHSQGEGDSHGDAHGGGHHDPHDLSEGNAGPMLTKPDDLKFDLAIYTAVVFFLLLAILGKFAWGPICHALEEREHGIAAKI